MPDQTPNPSQSELEQLRRRVAELEHALEVHEWGGQLFHESNIPQLLLDFETGAILVANEARASSMGPSWNTNISIACAQKDWIGHTR